MMTAKTKTKTMTIIVVIRKEVIVIITAMVEGTSLMEVRKFNHFASFFKM